MTLRVLNGPIILAGQSLSDPLDCTKGQVVRIHTPSGWSRKGDFLVPLTFQISVDGIRWDDLFDVGGREVSVDTIIPSTAVLVQVHQVRQVWVKFRSGTRTNPMLQEADREFITALEF
jgi:hypothetical protein